MNPVSATTFRGVHGQPRMPVLSSDDVNFPLEHNRPGMVTAFWNRRALTPELVAKFWKGRGVLGISRANLQDEVVIGNSLSFFNRAGDKMKASVDVFEQRGISHSRKWCHRLPG